MEAISKFIDEFACQREQYLEIEDRLENCCRKELEHLKIQFAWQSRVKEADSLQKKLQDRSNKYKDETENISDIKDLVAGRVILTRWKDFGLVENVIKAKFTVKDHCQHPKPSQHELVLQDRFRGYGAIHFHVIWPDLEGGQYKNLVIEIQVISAFMWAFATLEHDIHYKKHHGEPTRSLSLHIDMLKGIANLGESALEQYDELLCSDFKLPLSQQHVPNSDTARRMAVCVEENQNTVNKNLQIQKQNKKILSWISRIEVEADHHQVRTTLGWRYKGSGQWFRPFYDKWAASSGNPIFWLVGSVGTGKSSLVSNIIEWHFERIKPQENERLVFFYCSRKKGEKTTALEVFRNLVAQLAMSDDGLLISPLVMNRYNSHKNIPIKIEECSDLLVNLVKNYRQTTFIIDALDECDDVDALLSHLKSLLEPTPGAGNSTKLFLSSRNHIEVSYFFSDCKRLELENCKNLTLEDMKVYIETQVKEREKIKLGRRLLSGTCPELEDRLIGVLVNRSQGMFQWVKLQLDLFLGPRSCLRHQKDVIQKLNQLEGDDGSQKLEELNQAYEEIYENNTEEGSESRSFAVRALKWMVCALRPLLITELAEAASINDSETTDNLTPDGLLQICSNFIISDESGIAQFPHESVREYLERREIRKIKEYSLEQAHIQAAVTCLICLSNRQNRMMEIEEIEHGILEYSIICWTEHMAAVTPQSRSDLLQNLYHRFLSKSGKYYSITDWLNISRKLDQIYVIRHYSFSFYKKWVEAISTPPNALFAACVWGLIDMIPKSSLNVTDLKKLNNKGKSGLAVASYHGHYHIVKMLLRNGSNIESINEMGTVLMMACRAGQESVTRLLIDEGAEVNAKSGYHGNALQVACAEGHQSIVQLLIDKGAEINAKGGTYDNALQTACFMGHENIVYLLLDRKADVNAKGGTYGNALQAACFKNHQSIVQLLLDKGADINAKGGYYGSALQTACASEQHQSIVRLLLYKGADINAKGGYYGNALQAACHYGDQSIVQLLLDKGADVNTKDETYDNALQAACYYGDQSIVQLLLDRGADVNAKGGYYGSALQTACSRGHQSMVQLLLNKGADVNAKGGYYGSALQAACASDHQNIIMVQLLLDRGADVNAKSGEYGNALQAACVQNHSNIVQLLLDREADVNAKNGYYDNALQAACASDHQNIIMVQLLLDRKADVNAKGGKYGNALQAACVMNHENIVQLLLDKGANVNAKGGKYGNALQAAEKWGRRKIVQLLLDWGAKEEEENEGEFEKPDEEGRGEKDIDEEKEVNENWESGVEDWDSGSGSEDSESGIEDSGSKIEDSGSGIED